MAQTASPTYPPAVLAALSAWPTMPDDAYVRLPVVCALRASSRATVWRHVAAGHLPAPHHLGGRITAWRVGDLRAALRGRVAA